MPHSRWIKYLHWIGYVTTTIVAAQLLFLTSLEWADWRHRQALRAATLMQAGSAEVWLSGRIYSEEGRTLLSLLPPLEGKQADGFRFIAMPSFGDVNFAISMQHKAGAANGVMVLKSRDNKNAPHQKIDLKLSLPEYKKFVSEIDQLAEKWTGDDDRRLDGTIIVWERNHQGKVTTGIGNSPDFYGLISNRLWRLLRQHTSELQGYDASWHPTEG